ncbi:MAG: biotin--[acetyl-CoA-carboxylase] ligase [Gammaproteobacteria bacterium]
MRIRRENLINKLADGRFHSGQVLAQEMGVTRAAIWKQVRALADIGLDVFKVPGKGYRLSQPLELLDLEKIKAAAGNAANSISYWAVETEVDSTNALLRERESVSGMEVCIAECQMAGKGRRGRLWVSPFGANIYLSFSMQYAEMPADVSAVGLAIGVLCVQALEKKGIRGIGLKWPNDLVWRGRKLGGILLEMDGEAAGPCKLVIGVGINVHMSVEQRDVAGNTPTDLTEIGNPPSRNELAGALVAELVNGMKLFQQQGFSAFSDAWYAHDVLVGCTVDVESGTETVRGSVTGFAENGALVVRTVSGVRAFMSGEVSVRDLHVP